MNVFTVIVPLVSVHPIFRLKKTAEHRKTVLQQKKALEEKKAAIPFSEIEGDKSSGKLTSHVRLQQFLEKFGETAFEKAFTKKQIQSLCMAYGLQPSIRETKKKMVQDLLPVLKATDKMPQAYFTNVLQTQVNVDETNHRVTLRISRVD